MELVLSELKIIYNTLKKKSDSNTEDAHSFSFVIEHVKPDI